ncbi:IPP transferase-domain-containing protein [Lipomyces arxii]|uniref:IPP transferase-domain-containing protein n=1 Tax=Lipomyces arxii TaxID=56418 RepID=UPI0034CF103A
MAKPNLITIVGTTGVGKSKLSVALAKALNGEVVNADSMQMYAGLDTITNKHPVEEREGVPHHLLGHIKDRELEYSVIQFESEADNVVESVLQRQKVPILVGGTHYYIYSYLFKNKTIAGENSSAELPADEVEFLDNAPTSELFERLQSVDPLIAAKFHPRDRRKLRRALEICLVTGQRPSDIYASQKLPAVVEHTARFRTLVFWVWSKPESLDPRLRSRVDDMVAKGALLDEVREMAELYKSLDPRPGMDRGIWQVIGFKEFLPYIRTNDREDQGRGLDDMKRGTIKYASSQIKWIRKKLLVAAASEPDVTVVLLDASDLSKWDSELNPNAVAIATDFLAGKEIEQPRLAPESLQDMLTPLAEKDHSAKQETWKHYRCDICVENGENYVCTSGELWKIHLRSRRHRRTIKHAAEKEAFERWKASKSADQDSIVQ